MYFHITSFLKSTYFVKQSPFSYFRNVYYLFQLDWRLWLQINISPLRHIVFCVLRRQFWVWTRNTWSDTSVCWDLRQMLWKCLWIGPHFSYGQGKQKSFKYGNIILDKCLNIQWQQKNNSIVFILGSFYTEWASYGRNGAWN